MNLQTRFGSVESWIFDLDNTLYPPSNALFSQIDAKMSGFISEFLDVAPDRARALQKHYYHTYGTTLRGLMIEHEIDPHDFLDKVHDIDHSAIGADEVLGEAIAALPGRKFILTNGTRRHADNVSGRLGLTHLFDDVFDIVASDFIPKPAREPYDLFISAMGVDASRAAMFEDLARNLAVPHELGMRTVLVTAGGAGEGGGERLAWENSGSDAPHVDHATNDLAGFLTDILAAIAKH